MTSRVQSCQRIMWKMFGLTIAAALAVLATPQVATEAQKAGVTNADGFGTMHFQTRLGSFRIVDGVGRVEINFSGSVMISQLKGKYDITGNVKKEFEKGGRVIYSGKGHLVVTGEYRAVHWFGKDLTGVWYGRGVIRLTGEFDRDQKTGEYWFEDPTKVTSWPGGNTMDIINPPVTPGYNPNVKVKKKG